MSAEAITYDVAGIGSMVVDEIHRVAQAAGPDDKVIVDPDAKGRSVQRRIGGVVLNHLAWARLFGPSVAIFGKQADDEGGRFLRAGMARLGIATHLDLSGSASSLARVYVDGEGRRAIYMARGATAELEAAEIDFQHRSVIERARIVTTEVSQLPLAVCRRVLELARDAGAQTVLDLDVSVREATEQLGSERDLRAVLALVDTLKASATTLAGLVDGRGLEELARGVVEKFGSGAVAVTDGDQGSALCSGSTCFSLPAATVEVRDSTGAGDAFLGGLLAARVLGLDWEEAARLANACGAACCEHWGGFPEPVDVLRARALHLHRSLGGRELALPEQNWPRPGSVAEALERFLAVAPEQLVSAARRVDVEALRRAARLVRVAEAQGGRVHVTGVGKSEHVANYAAALLSSIGTPATFMHGTEVTHGSVGQIRSGDVVIAVSNSGTTAELLMGLDAVERFGGRVIAVTADLQSPLARRARVALEARVEHEGGPLGLAPRASVLAQALVLQALSVELQGKLSREEYHRRHPAGALGRRSRD